MDASYFSKELAKYPVIRRSDHYKVAIKTKPKNQPALIKAPPAKKSNLITSTKDTTTDIKKPFWEHLESSLSTILNRQEAKVFMDAMRKEHASVTDRINLEDLNEIAFQLSL